MELADPAYAARVVKMLLATYPTQKANDPDTYTQQLVLALSGKPKAVLHDICHPVIGVVAECRFLPTMAEIAAWCRRRNVELAPPRKLPPPAPPPEPISAEERARRDEMVRQFKQQAEIAANAMRVR
jgi:hypothetical protein